MRALTHAESQRLARTPRRVRGHRARRTCPCRRLAAAIDDEATVIREMVTELAHTMLQQIEEQTARIDALEKRFRQQAPKDAEKAG